MRLFAADLIPGLRLAPPALQPPWIMPEGLHGAHRGRLAGLLAQALRGAEPELTMVQLRWSERGLVEAGRLHPSSPVLVWWCIGRSERIEPREVLRAGSRIAPGLALFDFEGEHGLPALGWLGSLRLEVLRGLTDYLLDRSPLPEGEELVRVLRALSESLLSPVDLVDVADGLVGGLAEGLDLREARNRALARILAARFETMEGPVDEVVPALLWLGGQGPGASAEQELLRRHGLLDGGEPIPPALLLREEAVLRRTLQELAGAHPLREPLVRLAPGLLAESPPRAIPAPEVRHEPRLQGSGAPPEIDLARIEVKTVGLRQAQEHLRRGSTDRAIQLLKKVERATRNLPREEQRGAAQLYRAAARQLIVADQTVKGSKFERAAALLEGAAERSERGGEVGEAAAMLAEAGRARANASQHAIALALFERGKQLATIAHAEGALAACLDGIADVLEASGQLDEALRIREHEELPVYEKLGDIRSRAIAQAKIALVLLARRQADDLTRARRLLQEAEMDTRAMGLPEADLIKQYLDDKNV